jgi:hypothetical protein
MNNPRSTAIMSAFAAVVIGYFIFFSEEQPSTALAILQYVLFGMALVGLIGSLTKLSR